MATELLPQNAMAPGGHLAKCIAAGFGEQARSTVAAVSLEHYRWQSHCRGLFQLPIAA